MQVKAFLQVKGEVKQIRRLELTRTDYELLCQELQKCFGYSFSELRYKDSDGDLVTFESQKELDIALKFVKDDTLHVYAIGN